MSDLGRIREHAETQSELLADIKRLLDAQGRRVQPDLQPFAFTCDAAGLNVVVEPTQGQRIFVLGYVLVVAAPATTQTVEWGETEGTTFKVFPGFSSVGDPGQMIFSANGGIAAWAAYPGFVLRTEPSQGLALNLSAEDIVVGGHLVYWKA